MCGWLFSEFFCFRVCFPFHPILPRFVSAPANSFLWLLCLSRVFLVGNFILFGIVLFVIHVDR